MTDFFGPGTRLAPGDIEAEAASIGVVPAIVHAFVDVETAGGGFLPDNRPKILFEAHSFHQQTGGRYDRSYPNISSPTWNKALYGAAGAHQYDRLDQAIRLDRAAALKSASWGLGQVMGSNFKLAGFADVETFVAAMVESERRQLDAMMGFVKGAHLLPAMQSRPPAFSTLASGYNGSGQVSYYAGKLQTAYNKWLAHPVAVVAPEPIARSTAPAAWHTPTNRPYLRRGARGQDVIDAQKLLAAAGFDPNGADGRFGTDTFDAVVDFQEAKDLKPIDGEIGPLTWTALEAVTA